MTFYAERLPGEPIIFATLTGKVTVEDIKGMFVATYELAQDIGGRIYRVTDIRQANATFSDLMFILAELSSKHPGATTDPRIVGVIVGRTEEGILTSDSLKQAQYGQLNVPLFDEPDMALAYLRDCIALEQPN